MATCKRIARGGSHRDSLSSVSNHDLPSCFRSCCRRRHRRRSFHFFFASKNRLLVALSLPATVRSNWRHSRSRGLYQRRGVRAVGNRGCCCREGWPEAISVRRGIRTRYCGCCWAVEVVDDVFIIAVAVDVITTVAP